MRRKTEAKIIMAETKKISFGFTKLLKQPTVKYIKAQDADIQYIECLDSKDIKIKGEEEKIIASEIIIPLNNSINPKDNKLVASVKRASARDELANEGSRSADSSVQRSNLDDIAARELLEEARNTQDKHIEDDTALSLSLRKGGGNDTESTLDDYEAVPVSKFGSAMLRGMGWNPTKGIGKSAKMVTMVEPKVRPRGMGLGVVLERNAAPSTKSAVDSKPEEELNIVKGAYIQVTSGPHRDLYGQIEGFNEETGRLIVKLALGATSLSLNEYMVKPVSKDEFTKNSRVLNAAKFQKYKLNENQGNSTANGIVPFAESDRSKKPKRETERCSPQSRSRSQSRSASPPRRKHKRKERSRRRSSSSSRSRSRSPHRPKCDYVEKQRRRKKSC